MTKREQIEKVRQELQLLRDAVAGLDDQALIAPAIGEWGVREVMAHIAGWALLDERILRRLERGERPLPEGEAYGGGDDRNPVFAEEARTKSAAAVIESMSQAFEELLAAAESLPDERFAEGRTAQRIMQGNGWEHMAAHRAEIEAYRAALALRR